MVVFLSHLVSGAECGIRLYRFLIIAFSSCLKAVIPPHAVECVIRLDHFTFDICGLCSNGKKFCCISTREDIDIISLNSIMFPITRVTPD